MIIRSQDKYSRFVAWAKVGLYVGALMLLSTLFLFSSRVDVTDSLIYADLNVDEIIRNQRISNPQVATTLDDGTSVLVTAASAKPDEGTQAVVMLDQVTSQLTRPDGRRIDVQSQSGIAHSTENTLLLRQDVILKTDDGLVAVSDEMAVDVDLGLYQSNGPVRITGPFGTFDAGDMTVQSTNDGVQMRFTNGVHLVYTQATTD